MANLVKELIVGVVVALIVPPTAKVIKKLARLKPRSNQQLYLNYFQYGLMLLFMFYSIAMYDAAQQLCLLINLPSVTSVALSALIPITFSYLLVLW